MKLSRQILIASAITLASVIAPRFVDAGQHVMEMVAKSVSPNGPATFKPLNEPKQRVDGKLANAAP